MSKTDRIVNMLCLMAQKPGLTVEEMAEHLNASERTVYRYLNDLKKNGYHLYKTGDPRSSLQRYRIAPLKLTGSEALALVTACQPYLHQKGLPFSRDLETATEKIKTAICHREELEHYYKMRPFYACLSNHSKDYTPWEEIIRTIEEGMKYSFTLKADYDSFSSDISRNRMIDPYNLFWHNGNLYLAAFCHQRKNLRSFRVDRFISLVKTAHKFERSDNFDLENYLENSWRVYRGMKEIELNLLIYPPTSRLFRESRYHSTQKNYELEEGCLECVFEVTDTPELRSWLLSWGSQVVIQEPKELRANVKKELQKCLKNYHDM